VNALRSPSWPPELLILQGKRPQVRGSAFFGGRHGLVCLYWQTREVLPQRGHGLRALSRRRAAGVQEGDHGPFPRSPRNCLFAGEKACGIRGPHPLGAAMVSSGFLWLWRAEYCHNGGMAPPADFALAQLPGSMIRIAPHCGTQKRPVCRRNILRRRVNALWGRHRREWLRLYARHPARGAARRDPRLGRLAHQTQGVASLRFMD
jgi:hypothetical protein